jgi:hypothetical protein
MDMGEEPKAKDKRPCWAPVPKAANLTTKQSMPSSTTLLTGFSLKYDLQRSCKDPMQHNTG